MNFEIFRGILIPFLGTSLGAACVMIYVVVEELIHEMSENPHLNIGTVFLTVGFVVMMSLDVALS